jgi:quercetin dioxygenase-like cupin family protein
MTTPSPPVERSRRILLLHGRNGTSKQIDARLPVGFDITDTVYCEELWETPSESDLSSPADRTPTTVAFPQPGHVVARMLEFRPASSADVASEQAAVEQLMAGAGRTVGDLHRTQTTDYFSVVAGEVTLEAEGESVQLAAGDSAICLGGLHGWRCHTPSAARVFAVLVGARDLGDADSGIDRFEAPPAAPGAPAGRRAVLGHDAAGRSRILDDRTVGLPSRLWEGDAPTPTNRVTGDRWAAGLVDGTPSENQGFEVLHLTREQLRVPAAAHTLIGVVLRGPVQLVADARADATTLTAGEMFVVNGFDVAFSAASDLHGRVSLVTLPGRYS